MPYVLKSPYRIYTFRHLASVLLEITSLWVAAYGGFIFILPFFGIHLSYAETPLLMAAYYFAWAACAFFLFPRTLTHVHLAQSRYAYIVLAAFISFAALFYGAILPMLPGYGALTSQFGNFFLGATPDFFVPKMAELVFQQTLIVALVLSIASFDNNAFFVSLLYGLLFGIGHVFMLFEIPPSFTVMFITAAIASAFVFPYLILRVRNGFVYSFIVHWTFYMVLTVLFLR